MRLGTVMALWGLASWIGLAVPAGLRAQAAKGGTAASSSSAAAPTSILPPGEKPPPTSLLRIEEAGTAEKHPGADHLIVYDRSINHLRDRGVTYVDGLTLYKVLTERGARDLGVLRWNYDPLSSQVALKSVLLIRDGKEIPVSVDSLLDLPAPQDAIYWGSRIRILQLPRLQVNDGVEVRTFRKGFTYALLDGSAASARASGPALSGPKPLSGPGSTGPSSVPPSIAPVAGTETPAIPAGAPAQTDDARFVPPMEGEYFDIVRFQSEVPVLEKEYVLALPSGKRLQSEVYNGPLFSSTRYTADSTYYTWRGRDCPAIPEETRQPDETDIATKAVLTTVESWEAKSRWFFDVNRHQFEVTEPIREKVQEILRDAGVDRGTEEQKAAVLLHWVAQNIRYSGQTMGHGEGYTLHPGSMIFEQRSGVCKDIAGMLVTMMRGAEMDSYAAMTMAGSRIEPVPADQFNHCVVALRKSDGRYVMYDPTWAPFNRPIWSRYEAEQHYVIGSPDGETLRRIPYSPPSESPVVLTHEATLGADGSLEGTLRMVGKGAIDGRLRGFVSGTPRREIDEAAAAMLSSFSNDVEIVRVEHAPEEDFNQDMWIAVTYRAGRVALPVGTGMEFHSPMMALVTSHWVPFRAAAIEWKEERKTDVFLYFTQRFDGTETIRLPAGYRLATKPEKEKVDETYASFDARCQESKGAVKLVAEGEVRRRQIPPDGYSGFKKAMDRAHDWSEVILRVERGVAKRGEAK